MLKIGQEKESRHGESDGATSTHDDGVTWVTTTLSVTIRVTVPMRRNQRGWRDVANVATLLAKASIARSASGDILRRRTEHVKLRNYCNANLLESSSDDTFAERGRTGRLSSKDTNEVSYFLIWSHPENEDQLVNAFLCKGMEREKC